MTNEQDQSGQVPEPKATPLSAEGRDAIGEPLWRVVEAFVDLAEACASESGKMRFTELRDCFAPESMQYIRDMAFELSGRCAILNGEHEETTHDNRR